MLRFGFGMMKMLWGKMKLLVSRMYSSLRNARHRNRQTEGKTDRQIDKQQTNRQTDGRTER